MEALAIIALVVGLVALFAWLSSEIAKRPRLQILAPDPWNPPSSQKHTFARVTVRNRPARAAVPVAARSHD